MFWAAQHPTHVYVKGLGWRGLERPNSFVPLLLFKSMEEYARATRAKIWERHILYVIRLDFFLAYSARWWLPIITTNNGSRRTMD